MLKKAKLCEYCEKVLLINAADTCCVECYGTEVDKSVRLYASKKARCGHVSFDYFRCNVCKEKTEDSLSFKEFRGIAKQLRSWDPEKMAYASTVGKRGDALRNFPKMEKNRGYYFDKRNMNYVVRFKNKYVGRANTADEAHSIYMQHVEAHRLLTEGESHIGN